MQEDAIQETKQEIIRAKRAHVWMFGIACALLVIGGIVFAAGTIGYIDELLEAFRADPDQAELPGLLAILQLFSLIAMLAVPFIMAMICTVFWVPGAILSGIVSFSKVQKPRRLDKWSYALFCTHTGLSSIGVILLIILLASKAFSALFG